MFWRVVLVLAWSWTAGAEPFADSVKPLLRAQCAGCHGGRTPAGGFAVAELLDVPLAESLQRRERWERVAQRMAAGEMPPTGADAAKAKVVVEWVGTAYAELDRKTPIDPGRVTARRLNRFEYSNSVKDLLGVDMNPGEDFPVDPYGYGFDNIGDVLSMNAGMTEQYLKAAEKVARAVVPVPGERVPATVQRYLAERVGQDRQLRMHVDHVFPVDGVYALRSAFYQALKDGTRVRMRLRVDGKEAANEVLRFYYQIDRAVEARGVRVTAGRHRVEAEIEVLPEPAYKGQPPYLEYLQVHGPLEVSAAPDRRFFTCGHAPGQHNAGCARRILEPLARRAFRRPVTGRELDGLLGLAASEEKRTGSFEEALRSSLMAVLVSPHFLFRMERERGAGSQPLSGHELATRLSYFLWCGLPDGELTRLAEAGTLDAEVGTQARRMMNDGRIGRFVESFAGQWLQTRNLAVLKPDPKLFPAFTGELAEAMRTETEMFFAAILKEDRSILDFLDGRFTFVNERLAKHYGMEGVRGDAFRRVELDGVQRGGVLAHGSVLTVSSYPTRTSPVIRGKWVLENLSNQPPPPPPPDVPGLDEKATATGGSMRQQLERHRTNAVCAGCHSRMDPLGFGLENYDAIGGWREEDASGVLPGGTKFSTPAEMKQILRGEPDVFTRALTEKVLTYALGRGLELRDRAVVRRIVDRVRGNGYRFFGVDTGSGGERAVPAAAWRSVVKISRRFLLQGAGAALGLPWMEAMGAAPGGETDYGGVRAEREDYAALDACATGTEFVLPRTLASLERHKGRVAVLSGLAANQANALGDGAGDHARAASSYLTGVHPRKTEGADIRCGVSMDQIAAAHFAKGTRFPSLELTCEDSRQVGLGDSYSCVYQSVSWKSETQPMAPEMNPRTVFERLFGDASLTLGQRAARRSVLDLTRAETGRLTRELGGADRRKLDEYLTAIREVETRMEKAGPAPAGAAPAGTPTSYREHARLLFDLSMLAFSTGATRMITFMLAREGGLQTYPEAGVPEAHHSCTHHRNDPELVEKVAKINAFHVEQFAYFLDRMSAQKEGDATLLDNTVTLYGAAIGDPNAHDHNNLPTLVAGGGARGGRHVRYARNTPVANLHMTLLAMAGVPVQRIGDGTDFLPDVA